MYTAPGAPKTSPPPERVTTDMVRTSPQIQRRKWARYPRLIAKYLCPISWRMNPVAVATKPAITTSKLPVPVREPTRFWYVIATESTSQATIIERISPELNWDDTAWGPELRRFDPDISLCLAR